MKIIFSLLTLLWWFATIFDTFIEHFVDGPFGEIIGPSNEFISGDAFVVGLQIYKCNIAYAIGMNILFSDGERGIYTL